MTRTPIPESLGQFFSISSALDGGLTEKRLRADDLVRVTRGVRGLWPVAGLVEQAQAFAEALPSGCVYTHRTAAALLGLPVPGRDDGLLHVMTPPGSPRIVRAGVVGHRGAPTGVTTVHGVAVTDAVSTWVVLGQRIAVPHLLRVPESVMVADALLRDGWATRAELRAELDRRSGFRGVRVLRRAVELARVGSASPMESVVRALVVEDGLPEPEINAPVHDRRGQVIGRGDLVWREARVVLEYEGDQHRTQSRQWRHDLARYRAMREAGWLVIRVTAADVLHRPTRLLDEVHRALAKRRHPTANQPTNPPTNQPTLGGWGWGWGASGRGGR